MVGQTQRMPNLCDEGANKFVALPCDYDLTPLLRATAKQEWMVGQTQRMPNLCDEGANKFVALPCDYDLTPLLRATAKQEWMVDWENICNQK